MVPTVATLSEARRLELTVHAGSLFEERCLSLASLTLPS